MNNKLLLLLIVILPLFSTAQRKFNIDSLHREAAKTEFYTPVPPIVTPGKTPQDAHPTRSFFSTDRT